MAKALPRELAGTLASLEQHLKDPTIGAALSDGGVNVSLAIVALDGLRAYLEGSHQRAADELATAAEEIGARHARASTEAPS